jgi:transposase
MPDHAAQERLFRGRRRHRSPSRPGRGPHQCRHHRVAERADRVVVGRDRRVTIDFVGVPSQAVRDALPSSVLVADRFRLVALANDMLTQVRQRS